MIILEEEACTLKSLEPREDMPSLQGEGSAQETDRKEGTEWSRAFPGVFMGRDG